MSTDFICAFGFLEEVIPMPLGLNRRRPGELQQLRAEALALSRSLVHERNVRHELEREVLRLRRELRRVGR